MADYDAKRDLLADFIEPFTSFEIHGRTNERIAPKGNTIFSTFVLSQLDRSTSHFTPRKRVGHGTSGLEVTPVTADPAKKLGVIHFVVLSIVGLAIGTGSLISSVIPLLAIILGTVLIVTLEIVARRR